MSSDEYLTAVNNADTIVSLVRLNESLAAIAFLIVYDTSDDDSSTLLLDTVVTLVIVTSDTFKPLPIEIARDFANKRPFSLSC